MKNIKVVIGKNFGDEGKGAAVDWLCRRQNALVVRHNGGAQAGHTVEGNTFRFVFHQLGSGSFQGCPTYWSHTFLPDLLKLGEEMEAFSIPAAIYAHPACVCVTVYDVLLNSLREQLRGDHRHGSCGMGIFETVLRARKAKDVKTSPVLCLRDFEGADFDRILAKLRSIRDYDTKIQLDRMRAENPGKFRNPEIRQWTDLISDENVLYNAAMEMLENYRKYIILSDWQHISGQFNTILFENAQGLMLDWDNEEYAPHLTASYTGLKNVAALIREAKDTVVQTEVFYVTRTYVTRHGAGRLDHECAKEDINPQMTDQTNLPNPWQGTLRYARHPVGDDFFRYIRRDLAYLPLENPPTVTLLLTHPDETRGHILFADRERDLEDFREYCRAQAPGLIHKTMYLPWNRCQYNPP